jgi:alkanesulfonate monooxygenase SsuD/methylene tetrahydromethanopterin reductase-like flavin-dependent oxidoreductase (luciferase family)
VEYVIGVRGAPSQLGHAAADLEALGYHGVSYGDHRAAATSSHVWTTLAAIATTTSRVTISSSFANNLFRHPAELVQAALSIGALSSGRFEAGIGAGWARAELEAVGQTLPSPAERVDRLVEACQIARPLLRGEGCDFVGAHYTARFEPAPNDLAPPALVAAVGGPVSCRRIAPLVDRVEVMFGAAVVNGALDLDVWSRLTVDDLRRRIDIVRAAAPTVAIGVGVFVAAGRDDETRRLVSLAGDGLQSRLVGEPDAVADGLRSLHDLGIDRVGIAPMTASTPSELGVALLH